MPIPTQLHLSLGPILVDVWKTQTLSETQRQEITSIIGTNAITIEFNAKLKTPTSRWQFTRGRNADTITHLHLKIAPNTAKESAAPKKAPEVPAEAIVTENATSNTKRKTATSTWQPPPTLTQPSLF